MQQPFERDTVAPHYRYRFKSAIHAAGFRSNREFCDTANIDETHLSKIVRGWILPGPGLQKKMAEVLGITLRELRGLL